MYSHTFTGWRSHTVRDQIELKRFEYACFLIETDSRNFKTKIYEQLRAICFKLTHAAFETKFTTITELTCFAYEMDSHDIQFEAFLAKQSLPVSQSE